MTVGAAGVTLAVLVLRPVRVATVLVHILVEHCLASSNGAGHAVVPVIADGPDP